MNSLLIFFAFPIAVIIISIILQKLLDSPLAVAALIFAIFIVVTFAAFDETFLIATLAYTILAFLTAFLVSRNCHSNSNSNNCLCNRIAEILENNANSNNNTNSANASLQDLLNNVNSNNNSNNSCGCNNNDDDVLGINNNNTCGCGRMRRYRRF